MEQLFLSGHALVTSRSTLMLALITFSIVVLSNTLQAYASKKGFQN